mgnify:CR=1 FL=1
MQGPIDQSLSQPAAASSLYTREPRGTIPAERPQAAGQNSSQISSGIVTADRTVLRKMHLDANASDRSYYRHSAVTTMADGHAASSIGMPSSTPLTNGRSTSHVSSGHTSRRTADTA